MSYVEFFSGKMMCLSKVLEFSGGHVDSGTARNGEFRFFPKMSDFGFSDFVERIGASKVV